MNGLSFITLLAFDYRYAFGAVRSYYEIADEIILGLDAQRLSWTGQPYHIDLNELQQFITEVDHGKKIRIAEGDFHAHPQPIVNDTLERSQLSRLVQPGNWVVQIDADEVLVNPAEFRPWLQAANSAKQVVAPWITVFKRFGNQLLVVTPGSGVGHVATKLRGQYVAARRTPQTEILSPLKLLHFSWGRTPEELKQKLQNWGHARDFDTDRFFKFWESVTLENYQQARDFHPFIRGAWPALAIVNLEADENLLPHQRQQLRQTAVW
jgi:hypothetical protein